MLFDFHTPSKHRMKTVKLIHNPNAGDEKHSKDHLIKTIQAAGFDCLYTSTDDEEALNKIEDEVEFLAIAGGDGTVRTVVQKMLERSLLDKKYPLGILPMGTANNISKNLGLEADQQTIIGTWSDCNLRSFDIGKITDFPEASFFIEGLGFGVFPRLIKEMKEEDPENVDSPEKSLAVARKKLREIVEVYDAKYCNIKADGRDFSGRYLMVELMNIASIGPNLTLAPVADPADGFFELMMIAETQKTEFLTYLDKKQEDRGEKIVANIIKAKNVTFQWEGKLCHVDDKLIFMEAPQKIKVEMVEGVIDFLVMPS